MKLYMTGQEKSDLLIQVTAFDCTWMLFSGFSCIVPSFKSLKSMCVRC
jgi:hypothetical protein